MHYPFIDVDAKLCGCFIKRMARRGAVWSPRDLVSLLDCLEIYKTKKKEKKRETDRAAGSKSYSLLMDLYIYTISSLTVVSLHEKELCVQCEEKIRRRDNETLTHKTSL